MATRPLLATGLVVLLLAAGCERGPRRAAVSGLVLVDKEPLAEGTIQFYPTAGNDGPEVGEAIRDGRYSIPAGRGVVVGKNKVVIRGFRNSGKKHPDIVDPNKMVNERVKAVSAEFNDKSTLIREIQDSNNTLDFDLPGIK